MSITILNTLNVQDSQNDMVREIGILETVLSVTELDMVRRNVYLRKLTTLKKMIRLSISATRRLNK